MLQALWKCEQLVLYANRNRTLLLLLGCFTSCVAAGCCALGFCTMREFYSSAEANIAIYMQMRLAAQRALAYALSHKQCFATPCCSELLSFTFLVPLRASSARLG